MKLANDAVVTMSGAEYNQMQSDIDKAREAYESEAQRSRRLPLLLQELKAVRFELAKAEALNSTLLKRHINHGLTDTAYRACKLESQQANHMAELSIDFAEQYKQEAQELRSELRQAYELLDSLVYKA